MSFSPTWIQIDALQLENVQLKKTVSELKEIINNSRSSLLINRSTPLTSAASSTEQQQQQQPASSIRQIVREKLHKRSSSDLQQSLSSIDISMRTEENVVSCLRLTAFDGSTICSQR